MIRKRKVIPTKQKKKLEDTSVNLEADLGIEYISATLSGYANALRALPKSFDKLTREFGLDVYENMQADDEVAANIEFLVAACTAQDANVIPGVDQDHEEYDKALEINPNNSDFFTNRGVSYQSLGDHQQAIADFNNFSKRPDASRVLNFNTFNALYASIPLTKSAT